MSFTKNMENAICVKNTIGINKKKPIFFGKDQIGFFEELYFFPLSFDDILCGLKTFVERKMCPVILMHIDGLADDISGFLNDILAYNNFLGYQKKITLEIRLRTVNDIKNLSKFLLQLDMERYKTSIVINDDITEEMSKLPHVDADFLRVNLYSNILPNLKILQNCNGVKYKLARVLVSSEMDYFELSFYLMRIGFNGLQIIKGHNHDLDAKLDVNSKNQLIQVQQCFKNTAFDIFLESNIDDLNQPLFCLRPMDNGHCLSSLLILTIKNGYIMQCPYNKNVENFFIEDVIKYLSIREAVDTRQFKCNDCGYISDNNLYRMIYELLLSNSV